MLRRGSPLSRTLAIALLGAVVLSGYVVVVRPVGTAYQGYQQSIADSRELLLRFGKIAVQHAQIEQTLADIHAWQASQRTQLEAGNATLATAGFQGRIQSTITSNGAVLKSIQTLKAEDEGGHTKLAIRVTFRATTGALFRILYALEGGKPFVFLDRVDIRRPRINARNRAPLEEPHLEVRFDAYVYMPETDT